MRKIYYNGNSKVIKRLCERANDETLEKMLISLQQTVYNIISDLYGAVLWITDTNDSLVDEEDNSLMFISGGGNISDRLAALEALDFLTYSEDEGGELSGE